MSETLKDIKPGHTIWEEVWKKSRPGDDYVSHLDQLFEVKLQYAALLASHRELVEALDHLLEYTEHEGTACKLLAVGQAEQALAVAAKLEGDDNAE